MLEESVIQRVLGTALRTGGEFAEIFVEEDVLERSKSLRPEGDDGDPDRLKKWLEEVSPEELGKYPM